MVRTVSLIFPILLLLILTGCEIEEEWISFDDVSASYLTTYGPPEEINEYDAPDYHSIDWWWWSKGFMVSFLDTEYDDTNGWTVDHTYSFDPI